MIHQIVRHIGCVRKAVLCGGFHHIFVEYNRIHHAGKQGQAHRRRVDRVKYALFVLLHILIVSKRKSLHRREHAHQCSIYTAGLSSYQLCDIRILFLRHDAAAGAVSIINLHKSVLVCVPDDDLLRKTAKMHHDRCQRRQIFDHIIAVRHGIHAVSRRTCKAEQLRRVITVKRIGRTCQRTCSKRTVIHSLINILQSGTVTAEHFKIGTDMMRQRHRLCFLQMCKARHKRIDVLLHDTLQHF